MSRSIYFDWKCAAIYVNGLKMTNWTIFSTHLKLSKWQHLQTNFPHESYDTETLPSVTYLRSEIFSNGGTPLDFGEVTFY